MKYIWLLVLLGLMRVTWGLSTDADASSMQDITEQQNLLSSLIREQVKMARPNVKEVNFLQLYTEQGQKPGQILAKYRYAIVEPTANKSDTSEQIVEGVLKSDDGGLTWVVTNSSSPYLNFLQGTKISLKDSEAQLDEKSEQAPNATPPPIESPAKPTHTEPNHH